VKRVLQYRPSAGTVIGLTALVVAVGGAAYATIPDSGGTVHACYQKANGNLRVVGSQAECRASENALAFNQRGPAGPPGPPGGINRGEVFTRGGSTGPGETITLLEVPGLVRLTLRCPGPSDFAGGITHYNYAAENLDSDDSLHVLLPAVGLREIPPSSSVSSDTTIHQTRVEFSVLGAGKAANGVLTLYRQPSDSMRNQDCVYGSQALVGETD
jgi:hypothetical protein